MKFPTLYEVMREEWERKSKNPGTGKPGCPRCHGRGIVDPDDYMQEFGWTSGWTSGTNHGPSCPACWKWQCEQYRKNKKP